MPPPPSHMCFVGWVKKYFALVGLAPSCPGALYRTRAFAVLTKSEIGKKVELHLPISSTVQALVIMLSGPGSCQKKNLMQATGVVFRRANDSSPGCFGGSLGLLYGLEILIA